jgi:hypothetical protein
MGRSKGDRLAESRAALDGAGLARQHLAAAHGELNALSDELLTGDQDLFTLAVVNGHRIPPGSVPRGP